MNTIRPTIALLLLLPFSACKKEGKTADKEGEPIPEESPITAEIAKQDMPMLPLEKGDTWVYKVRVEIPAGVTAEGSAEVDMEHEMERVYLGKLKIGDHEEEVDVFEVTRPSSPRERELVEIYDDRIMMRGSVFPASGEDVIQWLEPPVPFVFAGMRPGQEYSKLSVQEGTRERGIRVVARENVTVPAGEFPAIRLLMTGNDGELLLRKTIWFSPKNGIVKEEKSRYSGEKLLFRETTELTKTTVSSKTRK